MGPIKWIKRQLMLKKDRKKSKKLTWGKVIFALVLLLIVAIIASFTPFGADGFQHYALQKPDSKWGPWCLKRAGTLYRFWSDSYHAFRAYDAYYTMYAQKFPDQMIEVEYWIISSLNDGQQYKRCLDRLDGAEGVMGYLHKYEKYENTQWYTQAVNIHNSLKAMDQSKFYDHTWY